MRQLGGRDMLQNPRRQVRRQLSAAPDLARWWVGSIGRAVAVGIGYFLAARLSLHLLTGSGVAVFWPAAGVAAGTLIALGREARMPVAVGVLVATIVANLMGDRTVWSATAFALCNAGETLLTAWLIEYYFGSDFSLSTIRHVVGLLVAAVVATAVSGIGAAVAYKLLHNPAVSVLLTWQQWFFSDALGIITVAPLLIGLTSAMRAPPLRSELIEGIVVLAAVAAMTGIIISLPREPWESVVPVALLFPLLLWLAARCQPVFASAAAFVVALAIVWAITFGVGHFGNLDTPMDTRILGAQSSILGVAICAFARVRYSPSGVSMRPCSWRAKRGCRKRWRPAVTAFDWDVRTDLARRSNNAALVLGLDREQNVAKSSFLARVHPDDRARFQALSAVFVRQPFVCGDLPLQTSR